MVIYCINKNKDVYACFVYFKKAFDSIPRNKIFEKLIKNNITGKFFECIKNIYSGDQACIKIGEKITDIFEPNERVKQGCILSPTLQYIFSRPPHRSIRKRGQSFAAIKR